MVACNMQLQTFIFHAGEPDGALLGASARLERLAAFGTPLEADVLAHLITFVQRA
jgi:hypothetical protein